MPEATNPPQIHLIECPNCSDTDHKYDLSKDVNKLSLIDKLKRRLGSRNLNRTIVLYCQKNKGSFRAEVPKIIENDEYIRYKDVVSQVLTVACPLCNQNHKFEINKPKKENEIIILNCPIKNARFETIISKWPDPSQVKDPIEITYAITPVGEALFETGKKIFGDSRSSLRDFSQFMTSISSAAIATYTGLIAFELPENVTFGTTQKIFLAAPALVLIFCIVLFVFIFQPKVGSLQLDALEDIMEKHQKIMNLRSNQIQMGMYLFIAAITFAIYNVIAVAGLS